MTTPPNPLSPISAEELVGQTLCEKWRVTRVLGVGGMSTVFEAVHRNRKRAALKVLHAELANNPRIRSRFLREGYIANRIEHPGIVSVLDDDTDANGVTFLVMELLEGETLARRLQRAGPLPLPEALAVGHSVLDVLVTAHRSGVIHRDIKPANVFITVDRVVKLLDFGIARVRELPELGAEATRSGISLGTPAFMAPEQARGRTQDIDERTDLWSVGALLFALLTGRRVHEAANANESMIAVATLPAPQLLSVASEVPVLVAELVDRALSMERAERWPDALSMQAALETAWQEIGAVGSPPAHVPAVPLGADDTLSETGDVEPPTVVRPAAGAAVLLPDGTTAPGSTRSVARSLEATASPSRARLVRGAGIAVALTAVLAGTAFLTARLDPAPAATSAAVPASVEAAHSVTSPAQTSAPVPATPASAPSSSASPTIAPSDRRRQSTTRTKPAPAYRAPSSAPSSAGPRNPLSREELLDERE